MGKNRTKPIFPPLYVYKPGMAKRHKIGHEATGSATY